MEWTAHRLSWRSAGRSKGGCRVSTATGDRGRRASILRAARSGACCGSKMCRSRARSDGDPRNLEQSRTTCARSMERTSKVEMRRKSSLVAALVVAGVLALACGQASSAVTWSAPSTVAVDAPPDSLFSFFDAAVRPDGSAIVALMRQSGIGWVQRSPGASDWTPLSPVLGGCRCQPFVATGEGANDVLALAPSNETEAGSAVRLLTRPPGADWTGLQTLPVGGSHSLSGVVGSGDGLIAYGVARGRALTSSPYVVERPPGADRWQLTRFRTHGQAGQMVVRVAPTGRVVAVWVANRVLTSSKRRISASTVWASVREPGGSAWSRPLQLSNLVDPAGQKRRLDGYTSLIVDVSGLDAAVGDDGTVTVGWGRAYRYSRFSGISGSVRASSLAIETMRLPSGSIRWSKRKNLGKVRSWAHGGPPLTVQRATAPGGRGTLLVFSDTARNLVSAYAASGDLVWRPERVLAGSRGTGGTQVSLGLDQNGSILAAWSDNAGAIRTARLAAPTGRWTALGVIPGSSGSNAFRLLNATAATPATIIWHRLAAPSAVLESQLTR